MPPTLAMLAVDQPARRQIGRPTERDQALADRLCDHISDGKSLRSFCAIQGNPCKKTFLVWLREDEEFLAQYTRAKRESAAAWADEIIEIADEEPREVTSEDGSSRVDPGWIAHQKNRMDSRKWAASKEDRSKYGETAASTTVNVGLQVNVHLTLDELESRLKAADA